MNLDIKTMISTIVLIIGVSIIATILLPVTTKPSGHFVGTSTTVVSSTVTTVVSSTLTTLCAPYEEGLRCDGNRLVGYHCIILPGGVKQCSIRAPVECFWPSPKCCQIADVTATICGVQVHTTSAFCKPFFLPDSMCSNL